MTFERDFLFIDNILCLGSFTLHHAERPLSEFIITPVFNIQKNETSVKNYKLVPGYLDRGSSFYACPLVVFYLKINSYEIKQFSTNNNYSYTREIKLDLEVFSKSFQDSIKQIITISEDNSALDFMAFNHIINFVNKFIEADNNPYDIDFDRFSKVFPRLPDRSVILSAIKSLDLTVYEDSKVRVGKDNRYWTDLEVRGLPQNKYIKNLIIQSLAKQGSLSYKDHGVTIELESDYAWSSSYSRRRLENYDTSKIRDLLKIDVAAFFEPEKYALADMLNLETISIT